MKGRIVNNAAKKPATAQATRAAQFFVNWIGAPRMMGAVAPSSRHLARAIANEVAGIGSGFIVELGGGTGSVTAGLLEAGIAPDRLVILERAPDMYATLKARFPQLRIIQGDAVHLRELLAPLGITNVSAVVSCLPLVTLPAHIRDAVLAESLAMLDEGGPIVQFTYSPAAPMQYENYGLTGRVVARVWRNLPPAMVWRFERRAVARAA